MTARARLVLMILAALVLVPAAFRLAGAMPTFGTKVSAYGETINEVAPRERRVTNAVTAVNFDYRAFDTLGEEFMLLAAVTGTVVLLRGSRGEGTSSKPGEVPGRPIPQRTDAAILVCRVMAPLVMIFGLYLTIHGSTTPGGGFQGGVIIASALLLVFLGGTYTGWRGLVKAQVLDWCEGGGALLFACMGFAALFAGLPFATNILPLGTMKSAWSGGVIVVDNLAVTLAVFGSFGLVFLEFLEETRAYESGDTGPGEGDIE